MGNKINLEYAPEGEVVSDFDLDYFVDRVNKSLKVEISSGGVVIKRVVSTWSAFRRLQVAVLRGEIAAESIFFEFENSIGILDNTGQVRWDGKERNWPRGCGDFELAISGELLRGMRKARKEKRDENKRVDTDILR